MLYSNATDLKLGSSTYLKKNVKKKEVNSDMLEISNSC